MDINSSSEDEFMTLALKEATDKHFFKQSFFTKKFSEDDKNKEKSIGPYSQKSLRPDIKHKKELNIFGVSDTFQAYVARCLYKQIDKSIIFVDDTENKVPATEKEESDLRCEIRLLSTFNTAVCDTEENDIEIDNFNRNKKCRKSRRIEENWTPHKEKIKEAAVNPEWILMKCDTKAWVNRRKDGEFKYKKLPDGTLATK